MKSYREKYFEDYVAVPNPAKPGKVKYVYSGLFLKCYVEGKSLKVRKRTISALEIVSIILYLASALQKAPFNALRITGGLGILALVPWVLEIAAVIRFIAFREFIPEAAKNETDKMMEIGALLHAAMMTIVLVAGAAVLIRSGEMSLSSVPAMAGHLISGILSILIYRLYRGVYAETYRNEHGKPGSRY
ncbi:MAG: hypothetical protein LIP10_01840 [Clostridiales bacterium]|nr:hypothetical protein [Clostridiales bacterium]